MIKNETEFLEKLKTNQITFQEQKSALYFIISIFVLGWITSSVDYTNFFSNLSGIIIMIIFVIILTIPFISVAITSKIAQKNSNRDYFADYLISSYFILKKLAIYYVIIILLYSIIYTLLNESKNLVLYEVSYYFVSGLTLAFGLLYLNKIINYFKYIHTLK